MFTQLKIAIDKIKEFLPNDIDSKTNDSFVIKVSNPDVHFLIQRARIEIKDMTSFLGAENVRVFGKSTAGQCNFTDNIILLNQAEPQTCAITVPVSGTGNKISMVLESRDGKLYIVHNSANRTEEVRTEIKEYSQGRWLSPTGTLIYRYPFQTTSDKIKYKEIYLYVNAIKEGDGIKITKQAGDRNFPTRISYPNSELTLID